jgi:hypothetical protein
MCLRKLSRFDGDRYQMSDPDLEEKLGYGWFGVPNLNPTMPNGLLVLILVEA